MGIILGIVTAGLMMIGKWDGSLPLDKRKKRYIIIGAILEGSVIAALTVGEPAGNRVLLSVLGGCLLLASLTDIVICQVYNFVWWLALAAEAVALWHGLRSSGAEAFTDMLRPLVFFVLVQFVLFRRMYGRADCYAFCICAIGEAIRGIRTAGLLLHMLLALMLLCLVQAVKGNINKKGDLKIPVPFIPYISISFWMMIALKKWLCHFPLFGIMEMLA